MLLAEWIEEKLRNIYCINNVEHCLHKTHKICIVYTLTCKKISLKLLVKLDITLISSLQMKGNILLFFCHSLFVHCCEEKNTHKSAWLINICQSLPNLSDLFIFSFREMHNTERLLQCVRGCDISILNRPVHSF